MCEMIQSSLTSRDSVLLIKRVVVRFCLSSSGTLPVLNTLTSMVARNQVRHKILLPSIMCGDVTKE